MHAVLGSGTKANAFESAVSARASCAYTVWASRELDGFVEEETGGEHATTHGCTTARSIPILPLQYIWHVQGKLGVTFPQPDTGEKHLLKPSWTSHSLHVLKLQYRVHLSYFI